MKRICLALVIGLVVLNAGEKEAKAQRLWEGMDVVRYCTGETVVFDESVCRAYLQGFIDAHEYYQVKGKHPEAFCVPKDKEARERGVKLFPEWLQDFKDRLHHKPMELAAEALHDIFPCPPPSTSK